MNALNIAVRCAALYTTSSLGKSADVTQISAVDLMLFADAITSGLADYWSRAPKWVTAPEEVTPLVTAAGTAEVTLPTHFRKIRRAPRIRASATEAWQELTETLAPLNPSTSGRPVYYRVRDSLIETPVWDEASNRGNLPDSPVLALYPTPDAVYSVDLQCYYRAPRITVEHLSGSANTVNIPVPDDHLVTMVIPLCAQHFTAHPLRKRGEEYPDVALQTARAYAAIAALPGKRTTTRNECGTPAGF